MTLTEKLKLKTSIQLFGGTAVNLGYKFAKSGKHEMPPNMLLELEDAMVPLVLHYNELLQSRDDYQKAADSLAAENKMLRESKSKPAIKIAEVIDGFCKQSHNTQYVKVFESGVRFAEKYHGTGGNE